MGLVSAKEMVTSEAMDLVEDRLGIPFDVEAVEVDTDSVTLKGIRIEIPEEAFGLRVAELVVEGDLMGIARREAGSVHHLSADGVEAELALDHPATERRLTAIRELLGRDASSEIDPKKDQTKASPEDLRERFDRVSVLLKDGAVLRVKDANVFLREGDSRKALLEDFGGLFMKHDRHDLELKGQGLCTTGKVEMHVRADLEKASGVVDASWSDLAPGSLIERLVEIPGLDLGTAQTSGEGRLELVGAQTIRLSGEASVERLTVRSPRLADAPVRNVGGTFTGSAEVDLAASELRLDGMRYERGEAHGDLEGWISWRDDGLHVDMEGTLPRQKCAHVLEAVPPALLDETSTFGLTGMIEGSFGILVNTHNPEDTELEIDLTDRCNFERVPTTADLRRFREPFEQVTQGHDGEIVHTFETGPGSPAWTPIEEVSPFFLQAVLAHEDAGFFRHHGFAVYAVEAALKRNLREGRAAFGASTISMQLAKNLFLGRDKTLARKAQEAMYTWWLERELEKKDILELYVNVIELGPEIFGIRQAADHYFGRHPLDLTPAESVFLSTLLPAPVPRYAQYEKGKITRRTQNEMRFLLHHMKRKDRLDETARDHGLAQLEDFQFFYGEPGASFRVAETGTGLPGELPFETLYVERSPEIADRSTLLVDRFGRSY